MIIHLVGITTHISKFSICVWILWIICATEIYEEWVLWNVITYLQEIISYLWWEHHIRIIRTITSHPFTISLSIVSYWQVVAMVSYIYVQGVQIAKSALYTFIQNPIYCKKWGQKKGHKVALLWNNVTWEGIRLKMFVLVSKTKSYLLESVPGPCAQDGIWGVKIAHWISFHILN